MSFIRVAFSHPLWGDDSVLLRRGSLASISAETTKKFMPIVLMTASKRSRQKLVHDVVPLCPNTLINETLEM